MSPGNDQNPERPSFTPDESPLRRRLREMDKSGPAAPGRGRPADKSRTARPKPGTSRRSIGPWDLIPIMIMIVVVWLWILGVIPSPFASPDGPDAPSEFWALAGGAFLILGAVYLFWLAKRLSSLGQYKSSSYASDVTSGLGRRRKTWSGRILRYLAFAMVLKVIFMLWGWGTPD